MLKGIIIFEQGGIQLVGELNSLQGIINTIKEVLPQLEKQEADRVMNAIPDDELERLLEARKNKAAVTGKTERLNK